MERRCGHCGATGHLVERQYHKGGVGYIWRTECRDTEACERRFDRKMRLAWLAEQDREQPQYSMAHPSGGRVW